MKKAISLVGVGAMVITLGLGTGFAQTAPKTTATPAVEAKQDIQKETGKEAGKLPSAVKPDVTDPVKPSEPNPSALKPGEAKPDKGATAKEAMPVKVDAAKPAVENKAGVPAPAKGSPAMSENKAGASKGAEEVKAEKAEPVKAMSGKVEEKKDSTDPATKK